MQPKYRTSRCEFKMMNVYYYDGHRAGDQEDGVRARKLNCTKNGNRIMTWR